MKLVLILAAMLAGTANRPTEAASPQARAAVQAFGACVARHSRERAAEALAMDFTTRAYRSALRQLANVNESCFRERGTMRTDGLPFAGALAEALLAADGTPLNVRLAQAALRPPVRPRSPSDRVAICIVRSMPDEVARLFEAEVGGAAEGAAIAALDPALAACSRAGPPLDASAAGLRAILATAAFRSVVGDAAAGGPGD